MAKNHKLNHKEIYYTKTGHNYIGSIDKSWFIEEDFLNSDFVDKFFSFLCDRAYGDIRDYILEHRHFDLDFNTINNLIEKLDYIDVLLRDFGRYVDKTAECYVNDDNTLSFDNFSLVLFSNN